MSATGTTPSKQIIVDMADMKAAKDEAGMLCSNILGACGAVAIYDPEARVGGLLHYLLPESRINTQRAMANPYLFADTGIPMLFRSAYKLGAQKERIICKLAGGCNVLSPDDAWTLGTDNHRVAEEVLLRNGVVVSGKHVGRWDSLRMMLNLADGSVRVALSRGEEVEL